MPHHQPPGMSPFRAVKATLDGVTSAPFATYHILTCIGLIAANHLLADYREHPRRVRLEEKRKRDEKWRREDEEDERLDRMMKQANDIPHMTRMAEGVTSYRETHGITPTHGDGPPPPFPPFSVPPRRAQTYTPNLPPPIHRDDPVLTRFPSPLPPGLHHQTCRPSPPGDQEREYHHPPPPPRQQPYRPDPLIERDMEYHYHSHAPHGPLGQDRHYHHPPAFLYPRYEISKAYAEKLEAKARGQWTKVDGLTAVQKGDAWERMRVVRAVPIKVMNRRVGEGGRGERKRVRWGGLTTREFVSEDEVLR